MLGRAKKNGLQGGAGFSFIGDDVTITGDILSPAEVHVDGVVEGDLGCAALILGEKGRVRGNIVADQARLAGLVDGSIRVKALTLANTARVTGDVAYESLSMEAGARVDGRLSPSTAADDGEAKGPKLIASNLG